MSLLFPGSSSAGPEGAPAICSRKACRAEASWQLLWNNPRIHTPERRKVWLSCTEHRGWLEDYLQTRGLWKETVPFVPEATAAEATTPAGGPAQDGNS